MPKTHIDIAYAIDGVLHEQSKTVDHESQGLQPHEVLLEAMAMFNGALTETSAQGRRVTRILFISSTTFQPNRACFGPVNLFVDPDWMNGRWVSADALVKATYG